MLINNTLVDENSVNRDDVNVIAVDADNIAFSIGSPKVSNIIMLAAYVAASEVMPLEKVYDIVMQKLSKKPEFLEMNRKAFEKGVEIVRQSKATDTEGELHV